MIPRTVQVNGRELLVQLLRMGEHEGLLTTQIASALGVTTQNIYHIIRRESLDSVTMSHTVLASLQDHRIINQRIGIYNAPNFLPRPTIEALVKIVNTPEAWALYEQLWEAFDYNSQL